MYKRSSLSKETPWKAQGPAPQTLLQDIWVGEFGERKIKNC
jgi:hypothetical protein